MRDESRHASLTPNDAHTREYSESACFLSIKISAEKQENTTSDKPLSIYFHAEINAETSGIIVLQEHDYLLSKVVTPSQSDGGGAVRKWAIRCRYKSYKPCTCCRCRAAIICSA